MWIKKIWSLFLVGREYLSPKPVWMTLLVNKYFAVSQCAHAWQFENLTKTNFVKIFGRAKQSLSVQCVWMVTHGGPYLQTQQTLFQTQHSIIKAQQTIIETQHSIIWTQQTVIETQHSIIEAQHNIMETQHSIIETQHNIMETQHNVIDTQHSIIQTQHNVTSKHNANLPKHNTIFARHNSKCFRLLYAGCYYTKHKPIITRHSGGLCAWIIHRHFVCYLRMWRSVARMDVFFKCLNCSEEVEETYQYCSRCGLWTIDCVNTD